MKHTERGLLVPRTGAGACQPEIGRQRFGQPESVIKRASCRALQIRLLAILTFATVVLVSGPSHRALAQTMVPPSNGPCVVVGNTATCTGDVSAGVDADTPLTVLNVNNLTQNIAPTAGVDGIEFVVTTASQDITVNVDTGAFAISVQNAIGIDARLGTFANNLDGNVSVTSTGNITTTGSDGINADLFGNGNITIISTGDISDPTSQGIDASHEGGSGNTTILSTGNITSDGEGINAFNRNDGTIYVRSIGNIVSDGIGIDARTVNGDVTVLSTGNITTSSGREGIEADTTNGNITIVSVGNFVTPGDVSIEASITANGDIVINSTGNITALFDGANDGDEGIFASIGGNGSISITSTGNIITDGDADSDGILARVTGTGNLTVDSTGNITTTGADGIEASVSAGSTADVTVAGGTVSGGTGTSAGVNLSGGAGSTNILTINSSAGVTAKSAIAVQGAAGNDTVNNAGTITGAVSLGNGTNTIANMSGGSITGTISTGTGDDVFNNDGTFIGMANLGDGNNSVTNTSSESFIGALITGAGNDTVSNSGTFTGTFDLGGGTNVFNNSGGGVLNSGATLSVGAGNSLNNAGTLSPGGSGTVQTTALTGNLVQTGAGKFLVDVDPSAGTGDRFTASGTAGLAGTVQANVVNTARGNRSVTILTAAGGTTNSGVTLLSSPALQASLSFPNANDVVLSYSIDFSAGGLNRNQSALGAGLNSAVDNGTGGLAPLTDALLNNIFTFSDYQAALNQLSPEVYLGSETAALFSAEDFLENLFSCRQAGENHNALSEGPCLWARPEARFLDRDSDSQNIGFDETAGGISAGGQVAVAPNWFAGFAVGYEFGRLNTDSGAESDSNRYSAGASIKYQNGNLLVAAALSGGFSDYDTDRSINFGGFTGAARANHSIRHVAGQARIAYLFEHKTWFAKPLVDVNVTHVSRDSLTETGTASVILNIGSGDSTVFSVTPALELGGDFRLSDKTWLRPFGRVGLSYYPDSDSTLTASFVNAPSGTSAFNITSTFDDVFADLAAGATAIFDNGATLGLSYEGLLSSNTQQHGISLKGSIPF